MASTLRGSSESLAQRHDVALLDLDGVVYIGGDAVPGAPAHLAAARDAGMRLAFVTNNAARPPQAVAGHLTELGIEATTDEVVTSSQAAARYLAEHLKPSARVLVLGTTGLIDAVRDQGLVPVSEAGDTAEDEVDAVVQGYSPDMNWRLLAEGAVAVRRGVLWVATNVDPTVPSPRGPLPGNGSLVAALRHATGVTPVVTGKPDPTMHRETLLRTDAKHPIVVGDRLDTDIEGANAVRCPSLLVLSGVTEARDLLAATEQLRPTYLADDVGGLLVTHPEPVVDDVGAGCGAWRAERYSGGEAGLRLSRGDGDGSDADHLDALRALCAAWWSRPTDAAEPGDGDVQVTAAEGAGVADVLAHLGLG